MKYKSQIGKCSPTFYNTDPSRQGPISCCVVLTKEKKLEKDFSESEGIMRSFRVDCIIHGTVPWRRSPSTKVLEFVSS